MRSRTTAALLILGTFALGVVSGAVGFSLYRTRAEAATRSTREKGQDIVERLAHDLQMDAAQKARLKVIMDKTRERFRAVHDEVAPRFDAIRAPGRRRVARRRPGPGFGRGAAGQGRPGEGAPLFGGASPRAPPPPPGEGGRPAPGLTPPRNGACQCAGRAAAHRPRDAPPQARPRAACYAVPVCGNGNSSRTRRTTV